MKNLNKLKNRLDYVEGRLEWLDELIPYHENELKENIEKFKNTEKETQFSKQEKRSQDMIDFREAIIDMVKLSILRTQKQIDTLKNEKEELLKEKELLKWDIEFTICC